MPGGIGDIFRKALGPIMTGVGVVGAPFTAGATLPLALGGLSEMAGPGGIMGPSSALPSLAPPKGTPALSAGPSFTPPPAPVSGGLSLSTSGAGPGAGAGAGADMSSSSPEVLQQAIQQAMMQAMGMPAAPAFGSMQ